VFNLFFLSQPTPCNNSIKLAYWSWRSKNVKGVQIETWKGTQTERQTKHDQKSSSESLQVGIISYFRVTY
jgi:hypothetical protein